jgi:hypothetical protein
MIRTLLLAALALPAHAAQTESDYRDRLCAGMQTEVCNSRQTASLQWIIDNPGAHPMNMWRVAQDGLRNLAGEK